MRVQLEADESGSLGVEIDDVGTVLAFTHRGSEAETSGLPLGGQIVGVNGERVRGAAAIHAALQAGGRGPFDLEVRVAPIRRSAPPPPLPPDLPPLQMPSDVPPPPPTAPTTGTGSPSAVGPVAEAAHDAGERQGPYSGSGGGSDTDGSWRREMNGAWWVPGQIRPASGALNGATTVTATGERAQEYLRPAGPSAAQGGTRYCGMSSSSDSDSDDGRNETSRARRASRSRGPSWPTSQTAQAGINHRSQQGQRHQQRQHRSPADRPRRMHREETSRTCAVSRRTDSQGRLPSRTWGVPIGHTGTGEDGRSRRLMQHRDWDHESNWDCLRSSPDAFIAAPRAQQRSESQGTRTHGHSRSSLVPGHEPRYAHEDARNRRTVVEEEDPRVMIAQHMDGGARHDMGVSGRSEFATQPWTSPLAPPHGVNAQHASARKFTEHDEVAESMQAAPFDDRSRLALGADPRAAGYARSGGAQGGEGGRIPPHGWPRAHAGVAFPGRFEADEQRF